MDSKSIITNLNSFKILKSEIQNRSYFHAYLFVSEDGFLMQNYIKYLTSLLLSNGETEENPKVLAESHPDVYIYPKNRQEDFKTADVSDILENANLKSIESDKKVIIIEKFEKANLSSQNKLLKILEEPPKNLVFLLCAENTNAILPTVLSRVSKINIELLSEKDILSLYSEEKSIGLIAKLSGGNLEKTERLLHDKNFLKFYEDVASLFFTMNHSKQIVSCLKPFSNIKGNNKILFEILYLFYSDLLYCKNQLFEWVVNVQYLDKLKQKAEEFSCLAITNICNLINEAYEKTLSNVNFNSVLENLIIQCLEVKNLCK